MRFRVQNIRKGYCEVWANKYDGQRYQKLAVVRHENLPDDKCWHWSAKENEPPFYMPRLTTAFPTRTMCVLDCEKWALKRLVERAIEEQPKESPHWHSPRRDAWCDVRRHDYLFAFDELEEIDKRLKTFEEE